jgi:uncharacterized protein
MAISKDLLDILVCPETKQDLALAETSLVETLNKKISEGKLKNRVGEKVDGKITGALIRKDNKFLYLIREDIPIMLIDEAISMDQIR